MVDICIPRLTGLHGGIGAMVDPCQKRWMNLLRALSLLSGPQWHPTLPHQVDTLVYKKFTSLTNMHAISI